MTEKQESTILSRASRYVNEATTSEERTRRKGVVFGLAYSSSGRGPGLSPEKMWIREAFRTQGTNHAIQLGQCGPRTIPLELVANKTTRVTVVDDSVLIEEISDPQKGN